MSHCPKCGKEIIGTQSYCKYCMEPYSDSHLSEDVDTSGEFIIFDTPAKKESDINPKYVPIVQNTIETNTPDHSSEPLTTDPVEDSFTFFDDTLNTSEKTEWSQPNIEIDPFEINTKTIRIIDHHETATLNQSLSTITETNIDTVLASQERIDFSDSTDSEIQESLPVSSIKEVLNETGVLSKMPLPVNNFATSKNEHEPTSTEHNFEKTPSIPASKQKKEVSTKPLNTKHIIRVVSIIVAILAVFYGIGVFMTTKNHVAQQFIKAVQNQNTSATLKLLTCQEKKIKLTEKALVPLFRLYSQKPQYFEQLASYKPEISDIYLVKSGKIFGIFDRYLVEVSPYTMALSVPYKNTVISIEGAPVATSIQDGFTYVTEPVIPGVYVVDSTCQGPYIAFSYHTEAILAQSDTKEVPVIAGTAGQTITINCSFPEAHLFADGKDTGLLIKNYPSLGPVGPETELYGQLSTPWGTMNTPFVKVANQDVVQLNFIPDETLRKTLMDITHQYNASFFEALSSRDVNKIVNASPSVHSAVQNQINRFIKMGKYYKSQYQKTVFDTDGMILGVKDEQWVLWIVTKQVYQSGYSNDPSVETAMRSGELVYNIGLTYDSPSQKWIVSYLLPYTDPLSVHTKEFATQ